MRQPSYIWDGRLVGSMCWRTYFALGMMCLYRMSAQASEMERTLSNEVGKVPVRSA